MDELQGRRRKGLEERLRGRRGGSLEGPPATRSDGYIYSLPSTYPFFLCHQVLRVSAAEISRMMDRMEALGWPHPRRVRASFPSLLVCLPSEVPRVTMTVVYSIDNIRVGAARTVHELFLAERYSRTVLPPSRP